MEITRRSFLAGLGSVSVGLLFARKLDSVIESLERDLVAEQQAPDQLPSAAEIVVSPQTAFRPERLVVPFEIAPLFAIENISIGKVSQFAQAGPIPDEMFSVNSPENFAAMDTAAPGMDIRFRVRYVGKDPRGARFTAAVFGSTENGGRSALLIDSGCAIVA
jgi:hypothetical protein